MDMLVDILVIGSLFLLVAGGLWWALLDWRTKVYLKRNYKETPDYITEHYGRHVGVWLVIALVLWAFIFIWNVVAPGHFTPLVSSVQSKFPHFKGWANHVVWPVHIGLLFGLCFGVSIGAYRAFKGNPKGRLFTQNFWQFFLGLF